MKKLIFILFFCITVFFIYKYFSYPKILRKIKKADTLKIVTKIIDINIQNENVINGSIEAFEDKYIFAFRKNDKDKSYIASTILDKDFKPLNPPKIIDVKSNYSEDPRIFKFKDDFFLIYNDKLDIKHYCRAICLSKFHLKDYKISSKTFYDLHIQKIEKNWTPFFNNNELFLAYGLVPHKVMQVLDFNKNSLKHLTFENNACLSRFYWDFGDPRGGTPAKLINGKYLSFFHSSFGQNKKSKYYVMGAYLFDSKPPYKILKISKFPLLFGDIKKTRIFFPTSFVIKKENNKDFIYLSYGVNDNQTKIAVIDLEKLLLSLKDVD